MISSAKLMMTEGAEIFAKYIETVFQVDVYDDDDAIVKSPQLYLGRCAEVKNTSLFSISQTAIVALSLIVTYFIGSFSHGSL